MSGPVRFWTLPVVLGLTAVSISGAGARPALPPAEQPARAAQAPSATAPSNPGSFPQRYTLPPEQRARAVAYSHAEYTYYFAGVALALAVFAFLWLAGIAVAFRNWARAVSSRHWIQCLLFVPLLILAAAVIEFPLDYASDFALDRRFGLSTETFGGWLADWGKSLGLTVVLSTFVVWILYHIIRRSPRRWWFYFWLATVPLVLGLILIQPVIIDPLFYKFTPLENTQPALTARIEQMLHHAGLEIPPRRIFEMNASTKTKALNAYVTGVGTSKRVVVWDTTLQKLDADETLLVLGHETGHYVLGHIPKEFAEIELIVLVFFYLGFRAIRWLLGLPVARRTLEGAGDFASLPILLLVLTALQFLASPAVCAVSRHYEHQADQFGLEVAYGIVPDPNAAEARSLEILGEEDLSDPDPSPFIKFWLYTHPPLDERIRFAAGYRPWAEGKPMELIRSGK